MGAFQARSIRYPICIQRYNPCAALSYDENAIFLSEEIRYVRWIARRLAGRPKLMDVEADSFHGEKNLDELCIGESFPCWRSKRGKHRLFFEKDLTFLKNEELGIEFRTGRNQSILPPSVIGDVCYEWIVSRFDVAFPPMPARKLLEHLGYETKSAM